MSASQESISRIRCLADGFARRLPVQPGQAPAWHLWKQTEIDALTIALASQRPLLVRGEPGTGKSQLAHAAAAALGWQLHRCALHARSEASDLFYQFDAVRRLADAQAQKLDDDERTYWQPQAMWQALDWESARAYGRGNQKAASIAETPCGHVVLIDEIDKAPPDVPNGLLEVMGARSFDIPPLGLRLPQEGKKLQWPLIIITTNEERDLPPAFQRRCMVLNHEMHASTDYPAFLLEHGRAHFGPQREGVSQQDGSLSDEVMKDAAGQLAKDRLRAKRSQLPPPGLAEYLDLLYALHELAPGDDEQQKKWLAKLNQYAFLKNRIDDGGDPQLRQTTDGKRKED